jgi:hypothetical protein
MKYYIYISDAKVNMLLPQIPHDLKKKLATEFKIDLKVLTVSHKIEKEIDDNRIARLEAVCNFIREYGNLGTVDESNEYIEDILTMSWVISEREPYYVYFSGKTDKTIFGLGGSSKHVIGISGTGMDAGISNSISSKAPPLMRALRVLANEESGMPLEADVFDNELAENSIVDVVRVSQTMTNNSRIFPKQRLEFVAKRLSEFHFPQGEHLKSGESSIVLATPLYVAMVE